MSLLKNAALRISPLRRLYEQRNRLQDEIERERTAKRDLQCALDEAKSRDRAAVADALSRSRFFHYSATFDIAATMRRFENPNLQPTPGYLTNWLGVRIDPKFFPNVLDGRAGEVEGIPIPANWHADMAEWGAVIQAIDNAYPEKFTMIELGCGWGCWMNNSGAAARQTGRPVHLIGVEGDEGHLEFARESLATNGFTSDQITLHRGIAAANSGYALFPKQDRAGVKWGLEPVFGATEAQRAEAVAAGSHEELPMISLAELTAGHERIDLLHVDIQGGEADLVDSCLPLLNEKVAYMMIGTHSKQIEGRLYETLLNAGWQLQVERAAIFDLASGHPFIEVDGVQGWRNKALAR